MTAAHSIEGQQSEARPQPLCPPPRAKALVPGWSLRNAATCGLTQVRALAEHLTSSNSILSDFHANTSEFKCHWLQTCFEGYLKREERMTPADT